MRSRQALRWLCDLDPQRDMPVAQAASRGGFQPASQVLDSVLSDRFVEIFLVTIFVFCRSGGPLLVRSDHSPSLTHTPVSGTPQRTPAHPRAAELQPYPRAPRGVFRPSKRKSPCGDPCLTVDREPAGTAPESDQLPAVLASAAPPATQRPRRDRSGYGERRYAGYPPPPPPPARNRPVAVAVRSYPRAEIPEPDVPAVDGPRLAEKSCGSGNAEAPKTPTVVGTADAPAASELAENLAVAAAADADAEAVDMPAAPVMNVEDSLAETSGTDGMESPMNRSKAPLRAVAIRRYPLPMQRVDAHGPAEAQGSEDACSSTRKAAHASVARRLRRSKPRLALRTRYAREAARARVTTRRSGDPEAAFGVSSGERLELGPLPACARPKVERVVPDLLSAAGVVSTKGPFDCDEEAGLPALTVPAKARSASGADEMALPMLEGVDVFEVSTIFEKTSTVCLSIFYNNIEFYFMECTAMHLL